MLLDTNSGTIVVHRLAAMDETFMSPRMQCLRSGNCRTGCMVWGKQLTTNAH